MMITSPYITKNLDVSTGHISQEDADILAMAADPNCDCITGLPIVHGYDEGFFVYVHEADFIDEATRGYIDVGLSKEFVHLIKLARSFDCVYLHLDADATEYDDLKKFDW